jgi:uncharacterized membrane protein
MTERSENYISLDLQKQFRTQAVRVWLMTSTIVFVWVAMIVAPPLLLSAGFLSVASPLYKFFGYICHQMPERSLDLLGHQMAVCSRCFGVYFGLFAGLLTYPLWRPIDEVEPISRIWLFLSLIPISIDWSLTVFGIWENTHVSRFVTGMILGAGCATFIVPAVVEIARNYSGKGLRPNS